MVLTIHSNDGWQSLSFLQTEVLNIPSGTWFLFHLQIHEQFWDRTAMLDGIFRELVPDKQVRYEQLLIVEEKWLEFLELIETWKQKGAFFHLDLIDGPGNKCLVKLEESNPDLIPSPGNPLFTISFYDSKMKTEFRMIVDPTSFVIEPS